MPYARVSQEGYLKMKVSCLPVSLFSDINSGKMSFEEWVASAPGLGLDGVDVSMMFLKNHTATYIKETREMLEKHGVPVVMSTTYPDFTHPDRLQRDRELIYFEHDLALCSQLGVKYLRVLAGQAHPETGIKDGIRWAIDGIRRSADIADKFGIMMLYEDHSKPGAWEYVDFSYPPEIFLEIMDGIWDTSVRINFDTGNIGAYGEDAVEVLKKVLPKVETVHVSDMAEHGKFAPVLIGTGATPIKECFSVLKKDGWDKWLCIEEASFDGLDGIKRAVENTRKLWEEA